MLWKPSGPVRARSLPRRIFFGLAALILLTSPYWVRRAGTFLVRSSPAIHADMIVVLAGDPYGLRMLKAAELVKQGYALKVLVSGPSGFYGEYESEPAIRFVVRQGYPAEWFVALPNDSHSTAEEAADVVAKLREWKVTRVDIVTSDFHTRRAGGEYRKAAQGIDFRIVAAPDHDYIPSAWWKTRQSRKTFAFEWMKTLATWVGL